MGILELKLGQAAVLTNLNSYININTLFWVVIVLAVLLLIALIYLANIKSYLKNNVSDKNSSVNNAVTQVTASEQGELVGNSELVAVITAAICASMDGASSDGLVVRSIRRVNR